MVYCFYFFRFLPISKIWQGKISFPCLCILLFLLYFDACFTFWIIQIYSLIVCLPNLPTYQTWEGRGYVCLIPYSNPSTQNNAGCNKTGTHGILNEWVHEWMTFVAIYLTLCILWNIMCQLDKQTHQIIHRHQQMLTAVPLCSWTLTSYGAC